MGMSILYRISNGAFALLRAVNVELLPDLADKELWF
jgi:hypothetical protein